MRALLTNSAMLTLVACLAVGATSNAQNGSFNLQPAENFSLGDALAASAASQQPYSPREHHASTAYGDVGKAIAAIMKAYTNGAIDIAKARIISEHAENLELQNSVNRIKANHERAYLRFEERIARQERKREHLINMKKRQNNRGIELANLYLPRTRFNPQTGDIFWPKAFRRPEMAEFRNDMEHLFRGLANEGPQYDHLYRDPIAQGCQHMLALLTQNREEMNLDWDSYLTCKTMIRGLALRAETWGESIEAGYQGSLSNRLASNAYGF